MEKSLRGTVAFCLWKVGFILITDILITSVGHYIHISNAWSYGNVRVPCWEGVQRVLHVVLFLPKNCPVMFLMASGLCVTGPSVWGQRDSYLWAPEPVQTAFPEAGAAGSLTNPPSAVPNP